VIRQTELPHFVYLNSATAQRVSSVDRVLGDLFHEQIRVLALRHSAKEVGAALLDSPSCFRNG